MTKVPPYTKSEKAYIIGMSILLLVITGSIITVAVIESRHSQVCGNLKYAPNPPRPTS